MPAPQDREVHRFA